MSVALSFSLQHRIQHLLLKASFCVTFYLQLIYKDFVKPLKHDEDSSDSSACSERSAIKATVSIFI